MAINIDIETGDKTYTDRVKRYEYIMGRLSDTPRPTLEKIGQEIGVTKQNVSRLIKRGTVRPAGRPPTNDGRRKRVMARLAMWQARRTAKIADGKDVAFEDKWIADLEQRLRGLG